ncbi:hypothetical protein A0H81_13099 [Grifola frondosa]|uniref:Uncharacterized protein n=1 Tax=Grifola frondosa TaxID=5627 RepID=A0A1C7LQC9_GRIFR|nr:hypothetical protein A0H81_13099 [Grifola frondosa]
MRFCARVCLHEDVGRYRPVAQLTQLDRLHDELNDLHDEISYKKGERNEPECCCSPGTSGARAHPSSFA